MDLQFILFFLIYLKVNHAETTTCSFPGAPVHSKLKFTDEKMGPRSEVIYTCDIGFELLGPPRKVCGDNGDWVPDSMPFCVINVAAGKAPMQISTQGSGLPQKAIDGSSSDGANTCTMTESEMNPWWYVNLLEPYFVQLVRLDFGKFCCGGESPVTIIIRVGNNRPDLGTNPICNKYVGFVKAGHPLFLPCNPPMAGAFVSVHLEFPSKIQLSICEAFVYTDQALPIEQCPQSRFQPPGSVATYNGKCYSFYDSQPLMFTDALEFCQKLGGTLVDESYQALQGFISWELWRRHRGDSGSDYWLGALRKSTNTANWKWINGQHVTISFWNGTGNGYQCSRFDGKNGWLWSDVDCRTKLNYICQLKPKTCGRPEQHPSTAMAVSSENFQVGSFVTYSCTAGEILVGPKTRTCQPSGFFDHFAPTCLSILCGYPADIAHGTYTLINDTISYMSYVRYSCHPGFEMVGRADLVCDLDARWNGPPPVCEAIHCNDPPAIANGMLRVNSTQFGSEAEFSCLDGYIMSGPAMITCTASGQWDQTAPICKAPVSASAPVSVTSSTTKRTPPPSTTERHHPRSTADYPRFTAKPRSSTRITTSTTTESNLLRLNDKKKLNENSALWGDIHQSSTSNIPKIVATPDLKQRAGLDDSIVIDEYGLYRAHIAYIIAGCFAGFAVVFILCVLVFALRKRKYNNEDIVNMTAFDTISDTESGLNRSYRQAWQNIHAISRSHQPTNPHSVGSQLMASDAAEHRGRYKKNRSQRHHHHHYRENNRV